MEARILGPVEVEVAGRLVALTGQRRAILAVLLVRRGRPTTSARLVDELWGETPPPTAIKSVQVRVAELRRQLPPGTLVTRPDGYAVTGVALDAARFESELAVGHVGEALALWRGPALEGVDTPSARAEAARLEELRLGALEAWAAAEIAAGREVAVVPELEAVVRAQPLRERSRALLMHALYRAGRQADALACYREGRAQMSELGLEPGPDLRSLELAVLRQDPSLAATLPASRNGGATSGGVPVTDGASEVDSDGVAPRAGGVAPNGRDDGRRVAARRGALALVVAGALAAVVALSVAAGGGEHGSSSTRATLAPPGSVAVIDPATNRLSGTVRVGSELVAVAVGAGGVWVADAADRTVARVDPRRRTVTRHIGVERIPTALAAAHDLLWVANATTGATKGSVSRIAVTTGASSTTALSPTAEYVDFGPPTPSALAPTPAGVWTNDIRRRLVRLDSSGEPVATAQLGETRSADGLILSAGALWAASAADDSVMRLDPNSGRLKARIPIAAVPGGRVAGPSALAAGFGSVWVVDTLAGAVSRINPRLNAVSATIPVGERPTRIAVGEGGVWVLDAARGTIVRIDPRRNVVTAKIAVGKRTTGLAVGAGAVWVTVAGAPVARGAPAAPATLRAVTAARCGRPSGRGPLLVVSDFPRHFRPNGKAEIPAAEAGIRWVFESRGYRAGRHRVAYQSCDNSTRELGTSDFERCVADARAFAAAPSVVGVIGPYHSDCARIALPVLNAAGPVAAIGPLTTYVGLTRSGPGVAVDEPERSYPTGVRNFVRLVGPDDAQGAALATLARQLQARHVYVLHDGQAYGDALARYFQRAAAALRVRIAGVATWDPRTRRYARLAETIATTGADAVVLMGCQCDNGHRLLTDLRARLPGRVSLLASDGFQPTYGTPLPVRGVYLTSAGVPVAALDARGRALAKRLPVPAQPSTLAAVSAAEAMLEAIARSDGTRASVNAALRKLRTTTITGPVRFDAGGDIVAPRFMVLRSMAGASGADTGIPNTVLDRMLTPAASIPSRAAGG